jgi:hypothetical protein
MPERFVKSHPIKRFHTLERIADALTLTDGGVEIAQSLKSRFQRDLEHARNHDHLKGLFATAYTRHHEFIEKQESKNEQNLNRVLQVDGASQPRPRS